MSKEAKYCKCKKRYSQDCRDYECKFDYMPAQGLGSLVNNGTAVVNNVSEPRSITGSRSGVDS